MLNLGAANCNVNSEVSKNLPAASIINIARKCVSCGVKKCICFKFDGEHLTQIGFYWQSK